MEIKETKLKDAKLIKPKIFNDNRGYFTEVVPFDLFNLMDWKQMNESVSVGKNILRGMHIQQGKHSQTKMIRVVEGKIQDIIIDLRESSPTYMQYQSFILSEEKHEWLFIPKGFAHGFLTLSERVKVQYFVDEVYNKQSEINIQPINSLELPWQDVNNLVLSEKDSQGIRIEDARFEE